MYFIFSPHLAIASALPGETENLEIASFHLNAACFLPKKHETRLNRGYMCNLLHAATYCMQ